MKHPVEIEESYNLFLKEYPDVLTTKDLQNILSVSSKTVFKLLHSGQIKSIKVGRNFLTRSICSNILAWSRMKPYDT